MSDQDQVNKTDILWIKESLVRIEKQTTRTNGRVSELEVFRAKVITYGSVALFIVPAAISLLVSKI